MQREPFTRIARNGNENDRGDTCAPVKCLSDEQLMTEVMAGEEAALALLIERYYGPMLGYLYRQVGGNHALAEDIVQETFLRVLQQRSYQQGRPVKPWLYAIATNLVRDYFKSAAVNHTVQSDAHSLLSVQDYASDPEEQALSTEQGRMIAAALGQLAEEYRSALLLRFYNGMSLQEIAAVLNIPLGTVKSRLSVGTHKLRALLAPTQEGLKR